MTNFPRFLFAAFFGLTAFATPQHERAVGKYEPTPEHPWGHPNPAAPGELSQMAFMVGDFECAERVRRRDGGWDEGSTLWRARYFLNGWAILDQNFKDDYTATNLRFYDPESESWKVSWFRMPGYAASSGWIGRRRGQSMVMEQESESSAGQPILDRLTFYDITDSSYRWKAERFAAGKIQFGGAYWELSCRRR